MTMIVILVETVTEMVPSIRVSLEIIISRATKSIIPKLLQLKEEGALISQKLSHEDR